MTAPKIGEEVEPGLPRHEIPALIEVLRLEMREAARELDFERAADIRDRIKALESERIRLS